LSDNPIFQAQCNPIWAAFPQYRRIKIHRIISSLNGDVMREISNPCTAVFILFFSTSPPSQKACSAGK
jgi:hypothetical protein